MVSRNAAKNGHDPIPDLLSQVRSAAQVATTFAVVNPPAIPVNREATRLPELSDQTVIGQPSLQTFRGPKAMAITRSNPETDRNGAD
jgi:hypothetical protein